MSTTTRARRRADIAARSRLLKLPKDLAATKLAMGRVPADPRVDSVDEGSRWWMTEAETIPYSAAADAAIPVGTVIPGTLIQGEYKGDRDQIRGAAKWADGWWTLEMSRDLLTGSKYDMQFEPGRADLPLRLGLRQQPDPPHPAHAADRGSARLNRDATSPMARFGPWAQPLCLNSALEDRNSRCLVRTSPAASR